MDDLDIATGALERESLPVHVENCERRYHILRSEIRQLRRILLIFLGVIVAGQAGAVGAGPLVVAIVRGLLGVG